MAKTIETLSKEIEGLLVKEGYQLYKIFNNPEFLSRFLLNFHLNDQAPFWDMEEYRIIPTENTGEHKVYVHYRNDKKD